MISPIIASLSNEVWGNKGIFCDCEWIYSFSYYYINEQVRYGLKIYKRTNSSFFSCIILGVVFGMIVEWCKQIIKHIVSMDGISIYIYILMNQKYNPSLS